MPSPKPTLLLLDTNVVLVALRLNIWTSLTNAITIVLPTTVIDETKYYDDLTTKQVVKVDLRQFVANGTIREESASNAEMDDFAAQFAPSMLQQIDAGEYEALALLLGGRLVDCHFSTGNVPAIKALALMGLFDQAISLEEALLSFGFHKNLPVQFTEDFLRRNLQFGQTLRIQGFGLAKKSRFRI